MSKENPLNLGFLVSRNTTGKTFNDVLVDTKSGRLAADIVMVVSDHPNIPSLTEKLIKEHEIPYYMWRLENKESAGSRDIYSLALAELLDDAVDVAVMDGFSTILSRPFMSRFSGVILNIHPGLVPDKRDEPFIFPDKTVAPWNRGLLKNKAVKNFLGGRYAGATVHVATEEPDFGPVLERRVIGVSPDDTVESLYPRIKVAEGEALLASLRKLASEKNQ